MVMKKFVWWSKPQNFGDVLTPFLLDHFNIKYKRALPEEADHICIGSTARLATPGMTVLGSGRIRKEEKADPKCNWRFVRGPLTRENVLAHGGSCPDIYGDPALLLPMFCPESKKEYKIGFVPHYQDYERCKYLSSDYHLINVVNNNPLEVAREISKCEYILSSSLHGIIAAHAYGIPAAHIVFSKLHGDGTKFLDYYQSVGLEMETSTRIKPKYSCPDTLNLQPIVEIFESLND